VVENYYLIGEVSKVLGIHEQTIRMYERKKLIKPHRSKKNTRLFTTTDILRLNLVTTLTQELGMNLSGVKLVFALGKKLDMDEEELLDFIVHNENDFITS